MYRYFSVVFSGAKSLKFYVQLETTKVFYFVFEHTTFSHRENRKEIPFKLFMFLHEALIVWLKFREN